MYTWLPVYDFFTVDEEHPLEKYNWGYDPLHYNSLEGSYSTNPSNGTERIKEFKQLVKSLHDSGIEWYLMWYITTQGK